MVIISVASVCMYDLYVCSYVCNTMTFENILVERSLLVRWDILRGYGASCYMKVIMSRSRSGAKELEIPSLCNRNLQSSITPVL